VWTAIKTEAADAIVKPEPGQKALIYGSDVSHRMVDFAQRNAERAGVADVIEFRGGDALQRMPPIDGGGVMLLNPPYGERIAVAGVAGESAARFGARELAHTDDGGEFFSQLASHWKKNFSGWSAWMLTPDLKLPGKMRLKESRRVPMWNGPIECRLFRFDMVAGRMAKPPAATSADV
jgi:putative N6-adenine-specific DNA methylase